MHASFRAQWIAGHALLREHVRSGADVVAADGAPHGNSDITKGAVLPTGFAVLDAYLPWQGWPSGCMTEIMTDTPGCGEMSLLLPAMSRLTQQKRPILCIGAPHEIFAPALQLAGVNPDLVTQIHPGSNTDAKHLKECLWCAEQALKTSLPGMVLLWSHPATALPSETLRRLHLSTLTVARSNGSNTHSEPTTRLIHFRGGSCMSQPSPAWLRFGYAADDVQIRLQIIKCRGRELTRPQIVLDREAVQSRLYRHQRTGLQLTNAVEFGLTTQPLTDMARQYASTALLTHSARRPPVAAAPLPHQA